MGGAMKVSSLSKIDFLEMVYEDKDLFLERIRTPEVFIVRGFYDPAAIVSLRRRAFDLGQRSEPSWHPLFDDCPDYHRLHDNYPNAYVKARMHAFYFHGWYEVNRDLF